MNSIKVYCTASYQDSAMHYFYFKKKFLPLLTKSYNEEFYYVYCPICGALNKIADAKKIKVIKKINKLLT